MGQSLKIVRGFDGGWKSVLKNEGVITPYPPDAPFDAKVWRGGDEATLFSPVASWIDSNQATFQMVIAGAQTTGLDPGLYRMQIGVMSGVHVPAFDGTLEIVESPGVGTLRSPYVTGRDLLFWYDQLETLQTIKGGDATFLTQRVQASDQFDRDLIDCYNRLIRMQVKVRGTVLDPILGTFDVPDPRAVVPTPKQFTDIVARNGVVADVNLREMISKWAIANILERQEVTQRNTFREEAMVFRARVSELWNTYDIQIDTTNPLDGIVEMLVRREITMIPTGSAP